MFLRLSFEFFFLKEAKNSFREDFVFDVDFMIVISFIKFGYIKI